MTAISERIFQLMEKQNISQMEFSKLTGIPYSTISDWKHKNNNPSADKILVICHTLQVSPEYLLGEQNCNNTVESFMADAGAKSILEYCYLQAFRMLSDDGKQLLWAYLELLARCLPKTMQMKEGGCV